MIKNEDGTLSAPKGEMTVLHLFTMTGGLTYNMQSPAVMGATNIESSTLDIVRAFTKDPIMFEPGTHYLYSLCHDVLAAVCEVITGKRFSEYLDELIFKPLGLKDIGFRPSEEQRARISAMYRYEQGTAKAVEISNRNEMEVLKNYESGGGGLFSSVHDYLEIITAVACGGTAKNGYRLLRPETVDMMRKNYLGDVQRNDMVKYNQFGYGWGLCSRVHIDPLVSFSRSPVGEFGWNGMANAYCLMDTENRLAIFYATHVKETRYGYTVLHPMMRDMIYDIIL
jgi:CubicO group peptidase (beta-lactamase class C family)